MSEEEPISSEDLRRENRLLRQEVAELRATCNLSPRERLMLEVISRVPFSVWACDLDCKIVLWEGAASKIYGHEAEEALGRDFVDLFVDGPEKAKARRDTRSIIEEGRKFSNFLASDFSSTGDELVMLTNCFKVWDAAGRQWLQAEVALEISDLESKKKEHKQLREDGILALVDKRQLEETAKANAEAAVEQGRLLGLREIEKKKRVLRDWTQQLPKEVREGLQSEKEQELVTLGGRIEEQAAALLKQISECVTQAEIKSCSAQIGEFRDWCEDPRDA